MNNAVHWMQVLESRRRFAIGSVLLLCIAILFVTSLRNPIDYDGYWHLRMGMDWVENGLSPWRDHYSFTYHGEEITSPPVAFQVALYEAVKLLGERGGFVTFKLTAFLLALACMLLWLRQLRAPVLAYCLVLPALVAVLQFRAQVRPELLSYTFSIIALMLYQRTALRLSARAIVPIAILLWLWTNYHASIVGYVIFFGLFVDIAVRLFRERESPRAWLAWAGWGVVVVGVGFLNPSFSHPLLRVLLFSNEWKDLIQEYQTPILYLTVPSVYVMLIIAALTLWLGAVQRRFGYLIVCAVLLYGAITMSRMIVPASVVLLGLFAHVLTEARLHDRLPTMGKRTQGGLAFLALALGLIPLLSGVHLARAYMAENRVNWTLFPTELVTYMLDNGKHGRIYNEYQMGGYLIYRLAPDSQVYIDGRTGILYPVEHYRAMQVSNSSPGAMRETVERYGIDYAVVENNPNNAFILLEAGFELEFGDVRYSLYQPENGRFAQAGRLAVQPYCWSEEIVAPLASERQQALLLLPPGAPTQMLLHLAGAYATAGDPDAFLESARDMADYGDPERRFLAYRALDHGLYDLALNYFNRLEARAPKDFLARALAHLRGGQPDLAEQAIDEALKIRWLNLEFNDLVLQYRVLREIEARRPLELFDDAYLQNLAVQVEPTLEGGLTRPLGVADFCGLPRS